MRPLNLLVLRCRNLERSRTFYECFGATFTLHQHGKGPAHLAHEDERGVLELYPAANDAAQDATGLGFASEDLSKTRQTIADLGFVPGPITDNPWGRTFVVRDPDGRRVEVKQL